jgi:carbon storage regulator
MLVLSRKAGERIWIGDDISVTVVRITGGGVRIGIEAPHEMPVVREELKQKMEQAESEEFGNGPSTIKFPASNAKSTNE